VPDDLLLTVLNGELRGQTFPVRPVVVVGSNRDCDLHLRDAAVSWNHTRFWREDGELLVEDLGSANGTFLNDRSIERASLHGGDRLRIGSTELSLLPRGADLDGVGRVVGASAVAVVEPPARRSLLERAEAAERELHVLRAQIAESRDEHEALTEARDKVVRLEKNNRRLVGERGDLERRSEAVRVEREAFEARVQSVQAELEATRGDMATWDRERHDLVDAHLGEVRALESKLRAADLLTHEHETRRQAVVAENHRLRERIEELVEGQEAQVRSLEESDGREQSLADRLLERERDIAVREGELAAANATVERLEQDRATLEAAIAAERDSMLETTAGLRRESGKLIEARTGDAARFREEQQQLVEDHRQQIAEAEGRGRRSLEGSIEELVVRAEHLESELVARDARIDRLGLERGEIDSRVEELGAAVVTRDSALDSMRTELQQSVDDKEVLVAKVESLRDELETSCVEHRSLRERVEAEGVAKEALRVELERLRGERQELQGELAGAREEIGRLDAGKTAADTECDRARTDCRAVAAERDVARSEVAALHVDLATLREDLGRLEELRKMADSATGIAREEVSRQHERQLGLQRDLETARGELVAAHEEREALVEDIGSLERAQAQNGTALEAACEDVRRLEATLDERRMGLEAAEVRRAELEARLQAAGVEVENERRRRSDSDEECRRAAAEADRMGAGVADLRIQVEAQRGERVRLDAALCEASDARAQIEAELERQQAELRAAVELAEVSRLQERHELETLEDARQRDSTELVLLRGYVDERRARVLEKDQQIEELRLRGRDGADRSSALGDPTFEVSHA